jgi:hypothetical protein
MIARSVLPLVLALAVAGCTSLKFFPLTEDQGEVLVQEGEVELDFNEPQTVFYPIRYASPPNLTVIMLPSTFNHRVRTREEKADGFLIEAVGGNVAAPTKVRWQARGCVPKSRKLSPSDLTVSGPAK